MYAKEGPPIENRERPLAGKIALVTGSSRDIGASIAIALAEEGVNIIGSYHEKDKRAYAVCNQLAPLGVESNFVKADITDEGAREKLRLAVEAFGGSLDFLILNASGKTREINVTAANALVDRLLPHMKNGAKIILMQSVPGHFEPQLSNDCRIPEFYREIAKAKHEGEQSLRARIPQLDQKGVSLLVVCPPEVSDTSNMMLFRRIDKEVSQKHAKMSSLLGLPAAVTSHEVGTKVAQLLKRNDLPQGYVELFGKTEDARSFFSQWYSDEAIFVDTFERVDAAKGIGRLMVTSEHTKGHFKPEVGISLLPGHKMIEAAAQTLGLLALGGKVQEESMPLFQGILSVQFSGTAKPGDTIKIYAEIKEITKRGFRGNARIVNQNEKDVAVIQGISASILPLEVAKRLLGRK